MRIENQYVMMCYKASEFIKIPLKEGDEIFAQKNFEHKSFPEYMKIGDPYFYTYSTKENYFFVDIVKIYNQKELQNFYFNKYRKSAINSMCEMHEWNIARKIDREESHFSFEILWLEFIMYKIFSKVWSYEENDWV